MKVSGRVVGIAALVVAIGIAFALRGASSEDSPEHRTDSDAANGASALPQLAQSLGHPATTLSDGFRPDLGMGLLFVLTPTTGFSKDDARRLSDYVAGGGTLVYASEHGDARLDFQLGVVRRSAIASGDAVTAGPMLAGVRRVAGAPTVQPLRVSSNQVTLLRSQNGQPVAVEELIGRGRMIALADPLPLCNGHLEQADNGRLAADLISLAPAGAAVAFDEYHHAVPVEPSPLTGWLSTAWGAAIAWAVLVLFAGLLLRGRAFGPRLALPGGGDRSSAEYVSAVGGLLQRSRAARLTGELLAGAARRALGARYGLSTGAGFQRSLRSRAPLAAAELEAAEAELGRDGAGESGLLAGARRLHGVAYPEHPQE